MQVKVTLTSTELIEFFTDHLVEELNLPENKDWEVGKVTLTNDGYLEELEFIAND